MKALVVINPVAGPGRTKTLGACVELATTILESHHIETDVLVTQGPDDAYRFSREAVHDGFGLVAAWGGDGTVNGCASAVARTGVPLAMIPGGSGNGLARDLGIPLNARQALHIAAAGGARTIDAGDLHGWLLLQRRRYWFRRPDRRPPRRAGRPPGARWLCDRDCRRGAGSYEPGTYSIQNAFDVDGKAHMSGISSIDRRSSSRSPTQGSTEAAHRSRHRALLDDGMIEIVVVEPQSAFSILRQVPAFFQGTLREGPGLLMRSASTMDVSCTASDPLSCRWRAARGAAINQNIQLPFVTS